MSLPRVLGSWKLGDGTEIPAVIEHDAAQQQLKQAQTPGAGRKGYKRGLDSAETARKASELYGREVPS